MEEKLSPYQQWKKNLGDSRPWDMINPKTEYVSKEEGDRRLAICKECPFLIKATSQCKKCGCFMQAKTRVKHAECPVGKW